MSTFEHTFGNNTIRAQLCVRANGVLVIINGKRLMVTADNIQALANADDRNTAAITKAPIPARALKG
jgi:hypothetical protein